MHKCVGAVRTRMGSAWVCDCNQGHAWDYRHGGHTHHGRIERQHHLLRLSRARASTLGAVLRIRAATNPFRFEGLIWLRKRRDGIRMEQEHAVKDSSGVLQVSAANRRQRTGPHWMMRLHGHWTRMEHSGNTVITDDFLARTRPGVG